MNSVNGWGRVARMVVASAKGLNYPHLVLAHQASSPDNLLTSVADNTLKPLLSYLDAARHYQKLQTVGVIHCLTEPMIPFALAAHKISGAELILNLYGTYAVKSLTGRLATTYRSAYNRAAALLLPSQYTAEQLLTRCPELESKIQIITLASSFPLKSETKSFRDRAAAAIFVGEIKSRKGVLPLLKATKIAVESNALKTLYIVGAIKDQQYYQQLLNYIEHESLGPHVIFTGPLSDTELSQLYEQCRVSALPSIADAKSFEGFGLVHLESFAHATPSIGCRNSGSQSAITDNYNGVLVEPMNVEQLAQALITIIGDSEVWNSLSQNCKSNFRSWDNVLKDYKNIYNTLAEV